MSKDKDAFNEARARFRSGGVGGQSANDEVGFRETEATDHVLADATKNIHLDDNGNVTVGSRAIKTRLPREDSMYGIIDAGLENNEKEPDNKETKAI